MKPILIVFLCLFALPLPALAEDKHSMHDDHAMHGAHPHHTHPQAPLGIMGDHMHAKGEWMVSYRFGVMSMDGNRNGTHRVNESDVLDDFMVAPTDMTTQMHMLGVMYAPSDNVTLMVMMPYLYKKMHHVNRMGVRFATESNGVGDLKLTTLYGLFAKDNHHVHLNLGISAPTGSVTRRHETPVGPSQKLPYPMQMGSGTWDLSPGITYVGSHDRCGWGAQFIPWLRVGTNSEKYTLGDIYQLTGWVTHNLTDWLGLSMRVDGRLWNDIDGADPDINPAMVPTANADLRGGERIDLLFGLNFQQTEGWLKGQELAIEGGFPVYQKLEGPQLESDWRIQIGWKGTWGK